MRALDRKLVRELWRLRGQMLSIAAVVATGIMAVITMRGSYDSLVETQARYYRQTRFASAWVSLKRAPESVRRAIEQIPGVAAADTRVTFLATLDLPGLDAPGMGRFISLPETGRPLLNDILVVQGRYLAPGERDAVIVSQNFAAARGLLPGDSVAAVLNGRARTLRVVGVAISPEHSYAIPPGSLFPDDMRYGILWMARAELGPVYELQGAFNEAMVSWDVDADERAVLSALDGILEPYGGLGAYGREDQLSHQILQNELDQNRVMSTMIPAIFLGVAAFLLNLVLGRLIATQRSEIAVLKAFGYTNREVGSHYLRFALAAVVVGVVVGTLLGAWLGREYVALYGRYFDFPDLRYQLRWQLVVLASSVTVLGAVGGAWTAVRRAVALPPAEAMRPEAPARFEPGWLERLGIVRALSPAARMIIRNVGRTPTRALLSALGVAFSVAILVVGLFMYDGMDHMMAVQFRVIQREDLAVSFARPLPSSVRQAFDHLPGVQRVELFRTVPARLRAGHRSREVALQAVPPDARMRRIVSAAGLEHPVIATGVVLDALLADRLHVAPGDTLRVEILEGSRATGTLVVAGVVEEFLGISAYVTDGSLLALTGGPPLASGAYLRVAADERAALYARLKALPAVSEVTSPSDLLASFQKQMADSLLIGLGFLLSFAGVIAVGVIYNGARVALSERGRELASLRVMGLHRREVAILLLGEQAGVTLMAIPIGWLLGYAMSHSLTASLQSETYRLPLVMTASTFVISAGTIIVAAAASAWIVRRQIDRLDLIAVLKTRE